MSEPKPAVAVMGAGAVGCYYGGMLALAGVPVTLIGRASHVDAIAREGLTIVRADRRDVVRVEAATDAAAVADAAVVLVSVKSPDTVSAAMAMKPHLRHGAAVVSLQNVSATRTPSSASWIGWCWPPRYGSGRTWRDPVWCVTRDAAS